YCPLIEELSLLGSKYEVTTLKKMIGKLSHLKILEVKGSIISKIIPDLLKSPTLKTMIISFCDISQADLSLFEKKGIGYFDKLSFKQKEVSLPHIHIKSLAEKLQMNFSHTLNEGIGTSCLLPKKI